MDMVFEYQGVTFPLDLFDADVAERYELALKKVQADMEKIEQTPNTGTSEGIRVVCKSVSNCFDSVFGTGAGEKIFGGKANMITALEAFKQLAQMNAAAGGVIREKYIPNRAARRSSKAKK